MDKSINPDMITLARESRGLKQSDLAERISITQGRLSKIESGILPVTEEVLKKISQALEYPENFFSFSDPVYGLGPTVFYHRKRQSLSPTVLKYIHAQINMRCIQVAQLLRRGSLEVRIHRMNIDEYDGRVEDIARAVRAAWLLPSGPINSVTKTIENAGGIIIKCDFGTRLIDATSLWPPGLPPLFFINKDIPVDRLRFTLCHELGHIIMHQLPRIDMKEMEDEANRFAGEFLMPRKEIRPSLKPVTLPKLAALKKYWKISMAAILEHAFRLGEVTARQRTYLWSQMGQAGYKTQEPVEIDNASETPTLLQEILNTFRFKLQYNLSELSHAVGLFESELLSLYFDQKPKLKLV